MNTHFSCVGCGKCCTDHHVPLTLEEARSWAADGGNVIVLVEGFLGEEARVRFGLLLKREGRAAQATDVFNTVLKRSRVAPAYYQREQREWIEIANREAAASPG